MFSLQYPQKGTTTPLTKVILDLSTLRGIKPRILIAKRWDDLPATMDQRIEQGVCAVHRCRAGKYWLSLTLLSFAGTTTKYSTVDMQFRFGQILKDDILVEAELILTSKCSGDIRIFNAGVYVD